jgi:hypothetical protein
MNTEMRDVRARVPAMAGMSRGAGGWSVIPPSAPPSIRTASSGHAALDGASGRGFCFSPASNRDALLKRLNDYVHPHLVLLFRHPRSNHWAKARGLDRT